MSKEHIGDDPRRLIKLLWGVQGPAKRGPKPRISQDDVVQAAIDIADREGLSAISMRTLAQAVGVSPMAIYTYVQSKSELLALMFDKVIGESDPLPPGLGWRESLAFVARARWEVSQRRPWLLGLTLHRPPLGPNIVAKMETVMAALDGTGLTALDREIIMSVLHNYIEGALNEARESREAEQRSGLTDAEWAGLVQPALQEQLDPRRFPHLTRLTVAWREHGGRLTDPRQRFEAGLQVMLDGIAAFIARRQSEA